MKSPADQKVIQIDITNACSHKCSNCTRFCGHHTKPFMMDFQTFKRAVDSLVDFPGMVGIMGGEPTLHPEFDRFVEYYASRIGKKSRSKRGCEPIVDFSEYRTRELSEVRGRRGLWSSLGKGYYKHFELIQEVFDYQCINDHVNPGLHQGLLISRKDLGISDEEWVPMRDACWIQNLWSSTVTPKGAFFCEVAGALDMLFDGPGGWDVNSEWWKKTPAEFGEQLKWCELCGAALQVPRREAREEVDDISPLLAEKLEALSSPKLRAQKVAVMEVDGYQPDQYACDPSVEWYLPEGDNRQRVDGTNRSLYPQHITAIVRGTCPPELAVHFDRVIELNSDAGLESILLSEVKDWAVLVDGNVRLHPEFGRTIRGWVLNPGCIYFQLQASAGTLVAASDEVLFAMFNVRARALRGGFVYDDLRAHWEAHKQVDLARWKIMQDGADAYALKGEMTARHIASLWAALCAGNEAVYLFGGGQHTAWFLRLIRRFELPDPVGIFDDAAASPSIGGVPVLKPEAVAKPGVVVISSNTRRVTDILQQRSRAVWGSDVVVVDPYQCFPDEKVKQCVPNV